MFLLKIISIFIIIFITLISGVYPFFKKIKSKTGINLLAAEALSAGVFLGAGMLHMLSDASASFYSLNIEFPLAPLLASITFLLLLLLDHIGREIYHKEGSKGALFAILSVVMLSVHSFLTGTALGVSNSLSITILILLAVVAHKWAESFAVSVQINKSTLSLKLGISLFLIFTLMAPIGILTGASALHYLEQYPLIEPIFTSLSAGTFIYLGTLHGLERSVMVKECCNLRVFSFVIVGFTIMAIVAIWL
ncbi:ZIP family metal transporter [Rickettsiales bacterium LUAb2]